MDVDRHVELHGRREETIIARVIEEAALGRAVDDLVHPFLTSSKLGPRP